MKTRVSTLIYILACCLAVQSWGEAKPWATAGDEKRIMQEFRSFLAGCEMRLPGSPGNLAMEEKISKIFAASGLQHDEIRFNTPCFIAGKTSLTLAGDQPITLWPMHPTLMRPGNFQERDFQARLVYLGKGTSDDLARVNGIDLQGTIGLMEFDSGQNWLRFLRFGVKGFIFIDNDHVNNFDVLNKLYTSEVAVPRFMVESAQAEVLRNAARSVAEVRIKAEPSRWENRELRDLYVFIPGTDPDLSKEVVIIYAPIDSNCIVPQKAFGAQSAANLFLLMQLYESFRKNPPKRSLLIAAINAHTHNFKGERMLAWHALADDIEVIRDILNTERRVAKTIVKLYSQIKLEGYSKEEEDILLSWRNLLDDSAAERIIVKTPVVTMAKRSVNQIRMQQLDLVKQVPDKDEREKRRLKLEKKRLTYLNVLTLFNKFGIQTELSKLTPEEVGILKHYIQTIVKQNKIIETLSERDMQTDKKNSAILDILSGRKVALVISLELDWCAGTMGFSSMNPDGKNRNMVRWGSNPVRIAAALEQVKGGSKENLWIDTMTLRGGMTEGYYFALGEAAIVGKSSILYFHHVRTYAFSLQNVFTDHGRSFLQSDTLENLDSAFLAQGLQFLLVFMPAFLDDATVTLPSELPRISQPSPPMGSFQVRACKFDELAASVYPDVPLPDTAIILRTANPAAPSVAFFRDGIICGDVINADIGLTDFRAAVMFYGLIKPQYSAGFHFADEFTTVDHTIDAGEVNLKVDSNIIKPSGKGGKVMIAMFECLEFPLYATHDSSLVSISPIVVSQILPMTPKANSTPKKFGLAGISSPLSSKNVNPTAGAPAAYYHKKSIATKFITQNKRLCLNATEKQPEGIGYASAAAMGSDMFAAIARDMSVLNHARLKKLKDVANVLMVDFLKRGDECLVRMDAFKAKFNHTGYLPALYEAMGAQVKSYEQAKQTTDDMLKAIVVYMALLLPFCFFVQKLVFKFTKIEHEMGMFFLLFILTYIVFRMIHPAFRIAQAPEAILIAFIMGALGLFVIFILRARFEGEMKILFSTYIGAEDDVGYSTVTQKAMIIGVSNMKRRRIRTMLTTATIILVAFAMLSFTSISKKVNPTIVLKNKDVPYTGFMYHWPGNQLMDEATLTVIKDMFQRRAELVVRRWSVPNPKTKHMFHIASNNGRTARMEGILGLSLLEDGFLDKLPIIAGDYFSADDAREIIITASTADVLGIDLNRLEDVTIDFQSEKLKLVGVMDDARFRKMQDLNGITLLPIKRIAKDTSGAGKASTQAVEEEIEALGMLFFVDTASLIIMPLKLAERFGAGPYSVSVKLKANESVWPMMDLLLTTTDAKFYISSLLPFASSKDGQKNIASGVYYIGSNYSTTIGGLAVLLVPLIIASTIILNTMLGSVYERKKEISIYNAIGLNPHHIGLFFLAESFVYGVIGAVGGYLIGQVFSIMVDRFGWITGINFNYSSLSVAYVIIFTIAIVLLSTLYPALVATKVAVPSGKRRWSMPTPDGHEMALTFPFIYHSNLAIGIMGYIHEYFSKFTEVSIGDLVANIEAKKHSKDAEGRDQYTLEYHTALVPYDLGVTQRIVFSLTYDDVVQNYRLYLRIIRISGQDTNWVTTNRPFLERLRKYLMQWRNLDITQQGLFVQQAKQYFGAN